MKAYCVTIEEVKLPNVEEPLHFGSIVEALLFNTPPGGTSTEHLMRTVDIYQQYKNAKLSLGNPPFSWKVSPEDFKILLGCIDTMRWGPAPIEVKLEVAKFCQYLRALQPMDFS
jgi:hypothetical protein